MEKGNKDNAKDKFELKKPGGTFWEKREVMSTIRHGSNPAGLVSSSRAAGPIPRSYQTAPAGKKTKDRKLRRLVGSESRSARCPPPWLACSARRALELVPRRANSDCTRKYSGQSVPGDGAPTEIRGGRCFFRAHASREHWTGILLSFKCFRGKAHPREKATRNGRPPPNHPSPLAFERPRRHPRLIKYHEGHDQQHPEKV